MDGPRKHRNLIPAGVIIYLSGEVPRLTLRPTPHLFSGYVRLFHRWIERPDLESDRSPPSSA